MHLQPAYKDLCCPECCPEAEKAAARVISLPLHPYMDSATQENIVKVAI
jgi:UDP-2-acetamido-2-deoxy-ribo-hexuluronate aminotransferase